MRRPSLKLAIFFIAGTIIGYALVIGVLMPVLDVSFREFSFGWVTSVAILIGMILVIVADGPFKLKTFEWPEEREKPPAEAAPEPTYAAPATYAEESRYQMPKSQPGKLFPYESQSEHWDIDFSDSHSTYEGADLPIWLLAGWAAFILWAVIYLVTGLPGAF